ncbi:MAG: transcription elongation factor Spt5 [Thermoprotei archaeon]|nr:MAG: transcription elongation factor Spt5 [Thermoprotei archaeon]RLE73529.1 MAG: transcription elongation factor Spt5 [Thermoprotei archaeon]
MSDNRVSIYAVRVTSGQEKNIALLLETRIKSNNIPIKSIIVLDKIKGFIFIESDLPIYIDKIIYGLRYIKGRMSGLINYEDLEKFISPKPIIDNLNINDIVEIIGGPFRGMRGKILYLNKDKNEIKVEIFEAAYPLPVTINADYVKIVKRARE